jgi:D-alanyl-D-alanine carboxypeptidase
MLSTLLVGLVSIVASAGHGAQRATPVTRTAVAAADGKTTAPALAEIDAYLTRTYASAPDTPGAAVIVVRDGRVLLRKGYGLAHLELQVPIAPEMVFRIGSITKQFTAVAVLLLARDGKLALDDDLTKFLPEYPTGGRRITIEHLLTHTSGIASYTSLRGFGEAARRDRAPTEVVDFFKNETVDFAPGEKWAYNNSGYFLLGLIVEKASGQSYWDFLDARIFKPLGMTHTRWGADGPIIAGRVSGYQRTRRGWENADFISMTQPYAAGALVSNVDDLAAWDRALTAGTLIDAATLTKAMTAYQLPDHRSTKYGYGWTITTWDGVRYQEHGGGIQGFQSYALRAPDERLFVAVLSNASGNQPPPSVVAPVVAGLALGKPIIDPPVVTVSEADLDRLTGVYRIDEKSSRTISREGAHLYMQRSAGPPRELFPLSPTEFFVKDSFVRVRFDARGGAQTALIVSDRFTPDERATRGAEPASSSGK